MGPSEDQALSPNCWLYAGLNMIRSTLMAEGKVPKNFRFSTGHLFFFSVLERSNRRLEEISRKLYGREAYSSEERRALVTATLDEGGTFDEFSFLVAKYGLVPYGAMPETVSSQDSEDMMAHINDSLAATTAELMTNAKSYKAGLTSDRSLEIRLRGRRRVWEILATHLGDPKSFKYRRDGKTRTYTPRQFARDFVRFDPRDYAVIGSYPGKTPDTVYEDRSDPIGKSPRGDPGFPYRVLNVAPGRLEALAAKAIEGGQPVLFAADMHRDVDIETGIMHPSLYDRVGLAPALTRKQASYFGRVVAGHAMVMTGLDRPKPRGPVVKYRVENSHGKEFGGKGYGHMYAEWFPNVFEIVVNKRFLSPQERKLWRGRAAKLGNWY
jgi:bleomycin hydrolase